MSAVDDLIAIMPNHMVMKEHEEPEIVIEPFSVRRFDKPDFFSDPALGMVKLDPRHDAQAKIRQTLADSYDALINQIGLGDPHKQDGGAKSPTNKMKSAGAASGRQ